MSLEDFQLLDNEPIGNSIIKRVFLKVYHQQGAQLNQSDQIIQFIFSENNNYHQFGNGYLDFNITVQKNDDTNFYREDPIRFVINGYSFCFKEARSSTTIGSDIEHNKFCGQASTIKKVISKKMIIYYLNLVILTKMIFLFLRDITVYHPKLDLHRIRKC